MVRRSPSSRRMSNNTPASSGDHQAQAQASPSPPPAAAGKNKGAARARAPQPPAGAPSQGKKAGGSNKKKSSPWKDPSPAQIQQMIRESSMAVQIAVEFDSAHGEPLEDKKPRLPVIECGVNSWQELVELQRLLETIQRPVGPEQDHGQREQEMLACVVATTNKKLPHEILQLSSDAVDSLHKFTTTLKLRIQSLGLSVRSLVGEKVSVAVSSTTTRHFILNALVIAPTTATTMIQRVILPPMAHTYSKSLSQLRNPQLVPLVDAMLQDHASSGRVQVVIVRGIPGSGKSSLTHEIIQICQSRGISLPPVVCSGDTYFDTPRGYVFDVKGLNTAHETAQKKFRDTLLLGLAARPPVVIVDNTNTQKWEYEVYEQLATTQKTKIHIFEMKCHDLLTCSRMATRNSHGVGREKVVMMFSRWENDSRSVLFTPQFHEPLVATNPVTRNPMRGQVVAYVGLFLDPKSRELLLSRVKPCHQNVIAEHVTLFFRPTTQYIRQAPIGKRFQIRVVEVVQDTKGQAVKVEIDCGGDQQQKEEELHLSVRNAFAHITISTAQGVSAFYSNDLLAKAEVATEVGDVQQQNVDNLVVETTLGLAVMGPNSRKVVTLVSPFEDQYTVVSTQEEVEKAAKYQCDTLVVLDVDEQDLGLPSLEDESFEQRLLRQQLIHHSLGAHASSRSVVVVHTKTKTNTQSEDDLLKSLQKFVSPTASSATFFDAFLVACDTESLAATLLEKQLIDSSMKKLMVLTTRNASLAENAFTSLGLAVSIKKLPVVCDSTEVMQPLKALAPQLVQSTLTRALDEMGVSTTEEACFLVQKVTRVIESVMATCGYAGAKATRLDSALWTQPFSVLDFVSTVESCCHDQFMKALKTHHGVQEVVVSKLDDDEDDANEVGVVLYFQLPTKSTQTPVIRWVLPGPSASGLAGVRNHLGFVKELMRTVRDSLSLDDQEMYPRLVALVSCVLRGHLKGEGSPVLLQLLCEKVVLDFFVEQTTSASPARTEEEDQVKSFMDPAVLWAQIVKCVDWLASWPSDRWLAQVEVVDSVMWTGKQKSSQTQVAYLSERVSAIFQAANQPIQEFAVHEAERPYAQVIAAILQPLPSDLQEESSSQQCVHRRHHHFLDGLSELETLQRCDQMQRLPLPPNDFVYCVPSGIVPGHVDILASSEQCMDQVLSSLS